MRCFHNRKLLFSLLFKKILKSCFIVKFMLSCTEYKFSLSITLGATSTAECPHCKLILEAASLPTHDKCCMDRPMKCPQCGEDIATKLWLDHKCLTARTNGISSWISKIFSINYPKKISISFYASLLLYRWLSHSGYSCPLAQLWRHIFCSNLFSANFMQKTLYTIC